MSNKLRTNIFLDNVRIRKDLNLHLYLFYHTIYHTIIVFNHIVANATYKMEQSV